ncbi:MAG TPA: multicopper oxidase family protein [Patescibacteria group bacterium]|nr:multicopper oxidase family protein [Patescibacteria group bacterium]
MPVKKRKPVKKKTFHAKGRSSGKQGHFLRNVSFAFLIVALGFFILSPASDFNPSWGEPERFVSEKGRLDASLIAQEVEEVIGGKRVTARVYNDNYVAPVLDVQAGDMLRINLTNNLNEPTNLHFHGGHVSPRNNSDNTLLTIAPGETFVYEYEIPGNHPSGLFWYHPLLASVSEQQIQGGMAGAIIVRGDLDKLPGIKDLSEKLLVLTTQDGEDHNTPVRLVNGRETPPLYIRPGEIQRWRIVNASSEDFFNIALPEQKLRIISRDGRPLDQVIESDSEVMAPGDRIEILVRGGLWGTYDVESLPFNQGFIRYEKSTIMHLVVAGFPVWPKELPTQLIASEDLRDARVNNQRTLTFSLTDDEEDPAFLLDGKAFNPRSTSQVMILGTTEEWSLVNDSREVLPFHTALNPFQVISINGEAVEFHGYEDTIALPAKSTVVMRTQYKDFDGKFFLYGGLFYHTDQGMMQLGEVIKPGYGLAVDNGLPEKEGEIRDQDDVEEEQRQGDRYQQ